MRDQLYRNRIVHSPRWMYWHLEHNKWFQMCNPTYKYYYCDYYKSCLLFIIASTINATDVLDCIIYCTISNLTLSLHLVNKMFIINYIISSSIISLCCSSSFLLLYY